MALSGLSHHVQDKDTVRYVLSLLKVVRNGCLGLTSMNEFVLFNISGGIGTALFFALYTLIETYYPAGWEYKTTVAWVVSYTLSIGWQHALHQAIVFGPPPPGTSYWASLAKTYVVYSASLVISSVLNFVLVESLGASSTFAFVFGLAVTGVVNYVASKTWAFADPASDRKSS